MVILLRIKLIHPNLIIIYSEDQGVQEEISWLTTAMFILFPLE
jgi:hypothetical protein